MFKVAEVCSFWCLYLIHGVQMFRGNDRGEENLKA